MATKVSEVDCFRIQYCSLKLILAAFENDPNIVLADEALKWLAKAAVPGNYLVDFLPFRRWLTDCRFNAR